MLATGFWYSETCLLGTAAHNAQSSDGPDWSDLRATQSTKGARAREDLHGTVLLRDVPSFVRSRG